MGLLDRVNANFAKTRGAARPQNLSFDEYANWFSFGGAQYPLLQTTYSQLDQERIAQNSSVAAKLHGPTFALIYARMQVFSQVRFQWTRFSGSQPGDLFGSAELRPLERPWPGGTTADLLARMEWDASTTGNAFIRRRADGMFRLHPQWSFIVLGSQENAENPAYAADTTMLGVLWMPPGTKPQFFDMTQVAHYAPVPDPNSHFLGMSWITSVLRDLQADQASIEHKWQFFNHAASPNMAISFDPNVGIEKVKEFKAMMETEHRGVANAWKTLYLGGGGTPTPLGSTFKEMDYAAIQGKAESRLAAAAGVPPSWVGFSEGLEGSSLNAGNFTSARRRFSDATMVHLWNNASASLEPIIATPRDRTGKPIAGASLYYDSRIPFMRIDEKELAGIQQQEAATITSLIREGYTPDSAVAAVKNNDWTLLKHTGLVSVQLWQPGTEIGPLPPAGAPLSGASPNGKPASLTRAGA